VPLLFLSQYMFIGVALSFRSLFSGYELWEELEYCGRGWSSSIFPIFFAKLVLLKIRPDARELLISYPACGWLR